MVKYLVKSQVAGWKSAETVDEDGLPALVRQLSADGAAWIDIDRVQPRCGGVK